MVKGEGRGGGGGEYDMHGISVKARVRLRPVHFSIARPALLCQRSSYLRMYFGQCLVRIPGVPQRDGPCSKVLDDFALRCG